MRGTGFLVVVVLAIGCLPPRVDVPPSPERLARERRAALHAEKDRLRDQYVEETRAICPNEKIGKAKECPYHGLHVRSAAQALASEMTGARSWVGHPYPVPLEAGGRELVAKCITETRSGAGVNAFAANACVLERVEVFLRAN